MRISIFESAIKKAFFKNCTTADSKTLFQFRENFVKTKYFIRSNDSMAFKIAYKNDFYLISLTHGVLRNCNSKFCAIRKIGKIFI